MVGARRRQRDLSFPLVICLLLLFPLLVDELFDRLRAFLIERGTYARLAGGSPAPAAGPAAGSGGGSAGSHGGGRALASLSPAGPHGAAAPRGGESYTGEGVLGLARIELEQIERWNELVRRRQQGRAGVDHGWTAVEPQPSNPSRFFPEYAHPMLSSGVRLSTSPPDPRRADPPPRMEPPREGPRVQAAASGSVPPRAPPAPRPLPPPAQAAAPRLPERSAPPPPPEESAEERTRFDAWKRRVAGLPKEAMVEICGRFVRQSQAAQQSRECAQAGAPPREVDEGGQRPFALP